ncbi:hypothetical protein CDL15_Pgr017754 [Punica granatum]|uniref:Uncharacterized protein n=1 Tax=Punica granatum TaxID=22663 RepID=A0A218WI17_PUNGR|nr:hypothetical protein CDL15_Pgr017754 [Punica granatum]
MFVSNYSGSKPSTFKEMHPTGFTEHLPPQLKRSGLRGTIIKNEGELEADQERAFCDGPQVDNRTKEDEGAVDPFPLLITRNFLDGIHHDVALTILTAAISHRTFCFRNFGTEHSAPTVASQISDPAKLSHRQLAETVNAEASPKGRAL